MHVPTPGDFHAIARWGLVEDPFAAVADYSEERAAAREDNDRHRRAREAYAEGQSAAFVADSQGYYRELERPIDRPKWEFLKRRKAWFHPPVGRGRVAAPGTARVLDLGCGDGDRTQRLAAFVAGRWTAAASDGFPAEIVGVDLSPSRGSTTPTTSSTTRSRRGCSRRSTTTRSRRCSTTTLRLTANGPYVRDLLDDYPGVTPRPDLAATLADRGFPTVEHHRVFEEPFVEEGTRDPMAVWPTNRHQVLFAAAERPTPPEARY
jgi:hypothetical protein